MEAVKREDIVIRQNGKKFTVVMKDRIKEGRKAKTVWVDPKYDASSHGTVLLQTILNKRKVFNYPKSLYATIETLKVLIKTNKNALVLDFFAGSGTTGHAVLELNKDDGGNRQFILCTNNENNIAIDVCYPRVAKVIEGYQNAKGEKVASLGGNLKYFRTAFVKAEPNDKNKEALTKQATEMMLCMREDTFDLVKETKTIKIFKNSKQHTGIVFDESAIPALKKDIAKIGGVWSVYIFSLADETFDEEFAGMKKVTVAPIPEAILRVYRRLFQQ